MSGDPGNKQIIIIWPRISGITLFWVMLFPLLVNLAFLDTHYQELCRASAMRAKADYDANSASAEGERIILASVLRDPNQRKGHRIMADAYQRRAEQSYQMQICVPRASAWWSRFI